jgi:hypothetical protein
MGTTEGSYLIFGSDHTGTNWYGSFLREVDGGGETWLEYPVDSEGWTDTGDWIGWVNVQHQPSIWSSALDKFLYIGDSSGWIFMPE